PEGGISEDARAVADEVAFGKPVTLVDLAQADGQFDSVLNVGSRARTDRPWTVINSDGWLARVASGGRDLPVPTGQTNPVAALAAASLGVAETFKRLLGVRASRGALLEDVSWSLFSYATGCTDLGPPVPVEVPVDLLLAGAGAIGNGVIHLLTRLPLRGRVLVVDSQAFGRENLGTCILIGPRQLGAAKVVLAEKLRTERVVVHSFHETLESFSRRLGNGVPYPRMAIGALDKIDARHALQDLWPDLLIDGAIGTFLCQVSRHPIEGDIACARCLFRHPAGERAEVVASRASGLSVERVEMPDAPIDAADLAAAPPNKREWLAGQLGKQTCSVVSEAVARELSDAKRERFEPSAPFVACLASSMMVAELVKATLGAELVVEPRFQFDVLRGPSRGVMLPQERRRDCFCTTRASTIALWRRQRSRTEPSPLLRGELA
ncbi:MAG: ThiF family adenylyltransferase, partial [Polyangiaceae bacterium]